jgi:chemotaxis protein methyltransferase CheR
MSQDSAAKKPLFDLADFTSLSQSDFQLTEADQKEITLLIMQKAGIYLSEEKSALIHSRVSKRLRILGHKTFTEYIKFLKSNPSEEEFFINSLTTNKTSFYRENVHFDFLKNEFLPEQLKNNPTKKIKIWSAAASLGHEVYTIAIVLHQFMKENPGWECKVLATDIDTAALAKAEQGVFTAEILTEIPPDIVKTYFLKGTGQNEGYFKISPELQSMVKFRRYNLVQDELPVAIEFNAIFLRNVLIYFQRETIIQVIQKMNRHVASSGCLMLGLSESLNGIEHGLNLYHSAIYVKK